MVPECPSCLPAQAHIKDKYCALNSTNRISSFRAVVQAVADTKGTSLICKTKARVVRGRGLLSRIEGGRGKWVFQPHYWNLPSRHCFKGLNQNHVHIQYIGRVHATRMGAHFRATFEPLSSDRARTTHSLTRSYSSGPHRSLLSILQSSTITDAKDETAYPTRLRYLRP